MANKIITLFIRDTGIYLLVVDGDRVQKWATMPLEPGLVTEGVILDEDQVARNVSALFTLEKIRREKVIVGLSGLDSFYRVIRLPEVPQAVLGEAVRYEASRQLPISLEDVYLSYQFVPFVPSPEGEKRIYLATTPRSMIDPLIRTLRKANVESRVMDLAPMALSRIPDEPRAVIVNVRSGHFDIMIIAKRLPELIRRSSLPSQTESLPEKLKTVSEEMIRTITFYNSSHLEEPLDASVPIFVSGELAQAPETWRSLVVGSGSRVLPLTSPLAHPESFPVHKFTVNIGLALRELATERKGANFSLVNLNVLPEIYQPKAFSPRRVIAPAAVIAGVGVLAFMGFLVQSGNARIAALRSQLLLADSAVADVSKEMVAFREQVKQVEPQVKQTEIQVSQAHTTNEIFRTMLADMGKQREQTAKDLLKIVTLLPAGVELLNVDHGGSSVTLSGTSPDEKAIFAYARALRDSGLFPQVVIESIQQNLTDTGERDLNFRIVLGQDGSDV